MRSNLSPTTWTLRHSNKNCYCIISFCAPAVRGHVSVAHVFSKTGIMRVSGIRALGVKARARG